MTRRELLLSSSALPLAAAPSRKPNVIVVISDDQGYGDLSLHGNPHLKTPNLDRIGTEGVQFTQFHSSPVCSPTRACLMTGRYNYRTGVIDTYIGRSMMDPKEQTMAQMFRTAGYRTGHFGKWHLGDHYPMRSIDKGFEEAVYLFGGGIGQPSDPPGGESYFNPLLQHNGTAKRYEGYVTDVIFDRLLGYIEKNRRQPFFTYVATNAPHTPLEIAEKWVSPFGGKGLDETTQKVYGMCANLDWNVGRLLESLKKHDLERDTIVLFMTDNGPQHKRYNAGMRGLKGSVYQGGIRVPCFVRWPGRIQAGATVARPAAHIDVLPTLAAMAGIARPKGVAVDGTSLWPQIRNSRRKWEERTLFLQWHRGDEPELFKNCAARANRFKLVDGKELYDLKADPEEKNDIASKEPDAVARMRRDTEAWFRNVSGTRGYAPVRIPVGTAKENPVMLSQQDWRGPRAIWGPKAQGHWEIDIASAGTYDVSLLMTPTAAASEVTVRIANLERTAKVASGATELRFDQLTLPAGPARLEAVVESGGETKGVRFATVRKA